MAYTLKFYLRLQLKKKKSPLLKKKKSLKTIILDLFKTTNLFPYRCRVQAFCLFRTQLSIHIRFT